ncbi:MAG: CehA/McbA family metallohydrolase [Planctomycetales bacterium]|nr:CehA/McbA family metallohydrolase [Planctomycetales bacterium]
MQRALLRLTAVALSTAIFGSQCFGDDSDSTLQIAITDSQGDQLPCRIHLQDAQGQAQRIPGLPFWHDHFVCDGRATAQLPAGDYTYAIERGPEYQRKVGHFQLKAGQHHELSVQLTRIANLRAAGWYSGDLHIHRPVDEVAQLMRAEDLDFAPVITWWNTRNVWQDEALPQQVTHRLDDSRIYNVMAGEDEREGGALLYFGLRAPLDIKTDNREFPSPMRFVSQARRNYAEVWIDIEKPFWWDVPVWLASGQMNSVGIANNHMCRSQMYPSEAWGKPRNVERLPAPRGNGYWTQEIYYHLLNCGLRLPPSAGSASGVLPNPVGYNRVYVHLDQPLTSDSWFHGLSRGRCFVTNGPLLLTTADGQPPGTEFQLAPGESRLIRLDIQLTSEDPVSTIEVIQNGHLLKSLPCSDAMTQQHTVTISTSEPGWFIVRAITDVESTFRFASTAPWFVEVGKVEHRISRRSSQFFLDWVNERIERVQANLENESERDQVLVWHLMAQEFWQQRLNDANSD